MLRFTHLAQGRSCSLVLLHVLDLVLGLLVGGLSEQYSYQVTGHMLQNQYQSNVRSLVGGNAMSMAEGKAMLGLEYRGGSWLTERLQ